MILLRRKRKGAETPRTTPRLSLFNVFTADAERTQRRAKVYRRGGNSKPNAGFAADSSLAPSLTSKISVYLRASAVNQLIILARPLRLGTLAFPSLLLLNVPLLPFGNKDARELPFHPANKNVVGNWVVSRLLVMRAIRGAFGGVYIYVDRAARALRGNPGVPVIFCSTHTGWWDGYMTLVCNRRVFGHDGYLMMEESNLARYPFLSWVGVFGVDREDPRRALASIEYITGILAEQKGASLWMFPQGAITHPDSRPLKLYGGVANIVRRLERCAIVPVAMRYEFLLDQAPSAFIRIDTPVLFDMRARRLSSRDINARLEAVLTATAAMLHTDLVDGNTAAYRRALGGRGSVNKVWDGVLGIVGRVRNALHRG